MAGVLAVVHARVMYWCCTLALVAALTSLYCAVRLSFMHARLDYLVEEVELRDDT